MKYEELTSTMKLRIFMDSYYKGFKEFFGVDKDVLEEYYKESSYSGYPIEASGSIWELEGKSLYCFIRCLKPKKVLEIGNFKGISSNHILQAVEKNGFGEVTLLDIQDRLEYDKLHSHNFVRVVEDSLKYLSSIFSFDCIVQDGCHECEHVRKELEMIVANASSSISIWSHDYYAAPTAHCDVKRAWHEMSPKFSDMTPMRDSLSNCGFVMARVL